MRIAFIVLLLLAAATPRAAEDSKVYKTTDEQGRPVFSDQAGEQAEEVEVREPMTFPADQFAEDYQRFTAEKGEEEGEFSYQTLAIVYPENNASIRSNPGDFEVRFRVSPNRRPGHTLQLLMDGEVYQEIAGTGSVMLTNVDRGTHRFQIQVVDGEGEVLQQGPPVTMHLLRHSIRHPQGRKSTNPAP